MSVMQDFKKFAMRGNVLDMAVGVVIGAAFGKIIASLVTDILMPPIGLLMGGVDFSNLFVNLSETPAATLAEATKAGLPVIAYGLFYQCCHQFPNPGMGDILGDTFCQQTYAASPGSCPVAQMPLLLLGYRRQRHKVPALHITVVDRPPCPEL